MSHWLQIRAGFMAALLLAGCDDGFEPIDQSGPPFSVFGYLDPSADTQWIRINNIRLFTLADAPEPIGAAAYLRHLGTGHTIVLRDTAMRYPNMIGGDSLYTHNFWTTERLEPGAVYRFRAESSAGEVAESVVQLPPDYLFEVWVRQPTASQFQDARTRYLRLGEVKHLPFIFWYASDGECRLSPRPDPRTNRIPPAACRIDPYWKNVAVDSLAGVFSDRARFAHVVVSGASWPFGVDMSAWRLAPESSSSNVAGAFGFLGGVLTKSTWIEDCALPYPSPPDTYCKLRYDSTTAILRGSLSSTCPMPLDTFNVAIRLRELEPPAAERPRTRFGALEADGLYDIGAIRPGAHELSVTKSGFHAYYDTLQFTAGRDTHHYATLNPVGACPQ